MIRALEPDLYASMEKAAENSQKSKLCDIFITQPLKRDCDEVGCTEEPRNSQDGEIDQEKAQTNCQEIANKHLSLFDGELGCFKGVEAKIHIKENARLRVMPAGNSSEWNRRRV